MAKEKTENKDQIKEISTKKKKFLFKKKKK